MLKYCQKKKIILYYIIVITFMIFGFAPKVLNLSLYLCMKKFLGYLNFFLTVDF